jgi:hypothetical protein
MSESLISIRQSTPLTILRLSKPLSEYTNVTASSSLPSTIDGRDLTPMSINYVIKVMSSYGNTIAIGDTLYEYVLICSQLSTNRFMSPRASESALSRNHRVRNAIMIAANNRTLLLVGSIGAKYIVFRNWVVLPYIERRVSPATQDI